MDAIFVSPRFPSWGNICSVSVTSVRAPEGWEALTMDNPPTPGLVIRFSMLVGGIYGLRSTGYLNYPVLFDLTDFYGKQGDSIDYLDVVVLGNPNNEMNIVGICGFPFIGGSGSLRRLAKPFKVAVFPDGCEFEFIQTHKNLNSATADSALMGAKLRSQIEKRGNLIVYSCYHTNETVVFTVAPLHNSDKRISLADIEEEHRQDIFPVR